LGEVGGVGGVDGADGKLIQVYFLDLCNTALVG